MGYRLVTIALTHSVEILYMVSFSSMVLKSSDFWVCPLIINSQLTKACIYLRHKFKNQQNAQHTAMMHYKHLRPA